MTRNKRKRKSEDQFGSVSHDESGHSSSTQKSINRASIQSLADDFSKILEIVTESQSTLKSIDTRLANLENRVISVENAQAILQSNVAQVGKNCDAVNEEVISLKTQMHIVSTEVKYHREMTSSLSARLMSVEYLSTENNIIVWNTVCDDVATAKSLFQEICTNGLELTKVPEFTIVTNKKEQKFFKVNVKSREAKLMILRNGKKLKNKTFGSNTAMNNVYVSDDAPLCVREARKRLYETKSKLSRKSIPAWVSNTVPPFIQIEREGVGKVKYMYNEPIPELLDC